MLESNQMDENQQQSHNERTDVLLIGHVTQDMLDESCKLAPID